MKKNKFLTGLSAIALASLVMFACSDEFLNAPPQGALDAGTLGNEAGVDASLLSAYSMLDGWANSWGKVSSPWPASGSNWIWGSAVSDDAHKGSEAGDQGQSEEIELFSWLPGNSYFDDKFIILYEGISRVNATLNLMAGVEGLDPGFAAGVEGEARFLRGHFHFDAYKMWGRVPYYSEADNDFRKPNDSDIMPNIIADFEAAVANLPVTQGQIGRVTKGAAQAYLGKALLYTKDYSGAKAQLDAVVNSGVYALSPCFKDIFSTAGENGPEYVFSYQASVNDGTADGANGNFGDRLNFPHGGSPFGCCGFHQPSQNLVNAYRVDDNGLPYLYDFNTMPVTDETMATDVVDPRLDITAGRDGVPYYTFGTHDPSWIRARSFSGPYSPKKFVYEPGQESSVGWSNKQLNPVNLPIIRYADVLLMLAEAEVELGNLERARDLVNMIRERAGNCAQAADGSLGDLTSGVANYAVGQYTDAWTDATVARDAVRFERRLELALEGHRFFDLRRWGIAEQVINAYLDVEKDVRPAYLTNAGRYQSPKNDVYPIPSRQIELSKVDGEARLQQNPGY